MVEGNSTEVDRSNTVGGAPLLTPTQYAEILKLLGSSNIQTEGRPMVNMAGTTSRIISLEWFIDTGANEHMIGDFSLLRSSKSIVDPTSTV